MGGFSNPVVGGMSKLIRAAIQSPNFQHLVAGWTINKDGSVEFQNATIRGTLSGSTIIIPSNGGPGTGIPYVIIDPVNGIQVFDAGNNLVAQMGPGNLPNFGGEGIASQVFAGLGATSGKVQFGINGMVITVSSGATRFFDWQWADGGQLSALVNTQGYDRYKIGGANDFGGQYYEEMSFSGFSLPANTDTLVLPQSTNQVENNYGAGGAPTGLWVAGTWTAKDAGKYTIDVACDVSNAAAHAYVRVTNAAGATVFREWRIDSTATVAYLRVGPSMSKYLPAGQQLQVRAFQSTGGAIVQSASTYVSIRRETFT